MSKTHVLLRRRLIETFLDVKTRGGAQISLLYIPPPRHCILACEPRRLALDLRVQLVQLGLVRRVHQDVRHLHLASSAGPSRVGTFYSHVIFCRRSLDSFWRDVERP
jgi:hypothetical protein